VAAVLVVVVPRVAAVLVVVVPRVAAVLVVVVPRVGGGWDGRLPRRADRDLLDPQIYRPAVTLVRCVTETSTISAVRP